MIKLKTQFFLLLQQIRTNLNSTLELNSASLNTFKKKLLNFIQTCGNSIFDIHNPVRIKFLTGLCLSLNHLFKQKFKECFQDTLNPVCDCGEDIESSMYFLLHYTNFLIPR